MIDQTSPSDVCISLANRIGGYVAFIALATTGQIVYATRQTDTIREAAILASRECEANGYDVVSILV